MALQRVTLDVPAGHDLAGLIFVVRSADSTVWWRDGAPCIPVWVPYLSSIMLTPCILTWLHPLDIELDKCVMYRAPGC